jgi:hypothetical protein
MRKTTLATILLAGFLLAVSSSTDFALSTPKAFATAAGTLKLSRALLTGHVFQDQCPAGTDPSTACFQSSGSGLIRGLGKVSERKLIVVDDPDSSCERWHSNSVIRVTGKGEIDLSLRPPNGCVIPTTGVLNASLVYTVTGGSGTYAGASGSGTFVVRGGPGTTGRETDTLSGGLVVPGLTFDLTPPIFSGVTSKTVLAPSGAMAVRVHYTVTARDPGHGTVGVRCKPRSGSRFKIGRTRVTCFAMDSSANRATARFTVIVKSRH